MFSFVYFAQKVLCIAFCVYVKPYTVCKLVIGCHSRLQHAEKKTTFYCINHSKINSAKHCDAILHA